MEIMEKEATIPMGHAYVAIYAIMRLTVELDKDIASACEKVCKESHMNYIVEFMDSDNKGIIYFCDIIPLCRFDFSEGIKFIFDTGFIYTFVNTPCLGGMSLWTVTHNTIQTTGTATIDRFGRLISYYIKPVD